MLKPIEMAHQLLLEVVGFEDVVVDATMGNGYDTLFLTELSNHVFAFDIQQAALDATKKRLAAAEKSARLILDGHENVKKYIPDVVQGAIFNLGYLPQTDKKIVTKPETTLTALSNLTEILAVGGRIVLVIYYGHDGGQAEKNAVLDWAKTLPQNYWEVMSYQALNEIHNPPFLVCIEKRKTTQIGKKSQ